MPLALIALCNAALGLLVAWLCDGELRASARGPWQTLAARALLAHQALFVAPLAAWWLWRAPDWSVSYVANANHAPSVLLAAIVLLVTFFGLAGFALGARWTRTHRAAWSPRAGIALIVAGVLGVLLTRARFLAVTSYVHFRGGLGPTPGERVSAPWWALVAIALWVSSTVVWAMSLRARTRALTLRNRG
jgi:hypothetical protein